MMHMRSVQEEIKIRQLIGHDEKHEDARDHKRDEKTEQGASRQLMRGLARDGMFRVQKSPAGLSRFLNCVENFLEIIPLPAWRWCAGWEIPTGLQSCGLHFRIVPGFFCFYALFSAK